MVLSTLAGNLRVADGRPAAASLSHRRAPPHPAVGIPKESLLKEFRIPSRAAGVGLLLVLLASCAPHAAPRKAQAPRPPSPLFSLTMSDLQTMVASMPAAIGQAILAQPSRFLSEVAAILREPSIYLVLVDKQHALSADYVPEDLVNLKAAGLSVSRADLELRKSVMPEVLAMVGKAQEDHVLLLFTSTYRSYAYQKWVYDREVRLYGKKVADSESAVPGTSQHQLGDTIDFGCICNRFASTDAYTWLTDHARQYGFSMTYPQGLEAVTGYRYEPWHWHYITTAGTTAQRDFFDDIQQYLLVFLHENRTQLVTHFLGKDLGRGWAEPEPVDKISRIPENPGQGKKG